jgi:hypothetical protein
MVLKGAEFRKRTVNTAHLVIYFMHNIFISAFKLCEVSTFDMREVFDCFSHYIEILNLSAADEYR